MKHIKLFDKVVIEVDGERTEFNSMPELFKAMNWDLENDPQANECADIITGELFCFRTIDISALTENKQKVVISWE